ncbi:MAG TPA: hypothetical protein ENI23_17935 [bacterium]|nr:hypothetical protein [bacterium]
MDEHTRFCGCKTILCKKHIKMEEETQKELDNNPLHQAFLRAIKKNAEKRGLEAIKIILEASRND